MEKKIFKSLFAASLMVMLTANASLQGKITLYMTNDMGRNGYFVSSN